MHVEISRIGHDEDVDAIADDAAAGAARRPRVRRGLGADARRRSRDDRRRAARATRRRSIRRARSTAAVAFLEWLADDHFTFLGYREYRLERDGRRRATSAPCPAPASASCAPTRTCRRRSAKLPDAVAAKAREKTLLVLAKANSRSTVHRPAYLDYVGVKTFDDDGEVVGERRFLGLFSSAAYTESV